MANLKDIIVNGTSRFIGKVFGPTPSEGDYSKQLATTEYVIDNSANQSISNLTEEGESKINASKCLLTNTIVTDPTAYNAVKSYSQDSFDLSKFTVVGSPTITDDGIASGFSGNFNTTTIKTAQSIDTTNANSMDIEYVFTLTSPLTGSVGQCFLLNYNNSAINGTPHIQAYHNVLQGSMISQTSLEVGGEYKVVYNLVSSGTSYGKLYKNGTLITSGSLDDFTAWKQNNPIFLYGYYSGENANKYNIDLKQFNVKVDGKEVFSGNKTGLDAIKPLDAEELGDIYVNEHGIAENFNVNNAIKAPISFNPISTVKIRSLLTWNTGSTQPKDGINVPYVFGPNKWRLEVTSTNVYATNDLDTSTNTAFNIAIPELQNGNVIEIIETITIGTRTVKIIINETEEYSGSTAFAANQVFSTSELAIGNAAFDGSSEYFWNGAINLNMFIVYIDGKLAYEPCLYIPYTQSKTGSKIVENVYRNRVYELYAQTGKAEYYTLDIENENITLPLGEIYGLITSKADTVNVANKSLEDLTDDGNALINNSKAWITGKLTNDKTTYDAIKKLSVSTFDKSKFTVVGSPTITEDGVALTTSSGNYVKTPVVDFSTASTWKINGKFKTQSTAVESNILSGDTDQYLAIVFNGVSKNIRIALGDGSSWFISNVTGASNLSLNTEYEYEFIYDGTGYLLNLNGSEYISKQTSASKVGNTSVLLGVNRNGFEPSANDKTIDLKQFSITVDGVEVFSGNKTGLDVIKPDNYTVVGSPVISEDGVASGFSSKNYITVPIDLSQATDYEIVISVKWNSFVGTATVLFSGTANNKGLGIAFRGSDNNIACYGGNTSLNDVFSGKITTNANGKLLKFKYKNNIYSLSTSSDGITWDESWNVTSTTKLSFGSIIQIGHSVNFSNAWSLITSLNAFKIYVDGNLVYQPCLKIPYTLSKTGSKIVDAAYYDRVIDVYEQYGSAYYYTLDRQNNLSSLPFGDIYGLMMKKDDSPDYFSADIPAEFPFIAWREGYINVTVPANEKLLINDNEVVSAGTSAVQMQLRVGLYDNITFSNTVGATLTFYPCKGVLYTI